MTETFDGSDDRLELNAQDQRIRKLNDLLRQTFIGGRVLMTQGVNALDDDLKERVLTAIRAFDDFSEDNDPYGTHEFGGVEIDGIRVWFKIDAYDKNHHYGSPDPSDPAVTARVMTILLPEEY
jgi:hypothetical protein